MRKKVKKSTEKVDLLGRRVAEVCKELDHVGKKIIKEQSLEKILDDLQRLGAQVDQFEQEEVNGGEEDLRRMEQEIEDTLKEEQLKQKRACDDKIKEGQQLLKDLEGEFNRVQEEIKDFLEELARAGDNIDPEVRSDVA